MKKNYCLLIFVISMQLISAQERLFNPSLWVHQSDISKEASSTVTYFNFNPVFSATKMEDYTFKNIKTSKFSLFAAFKSDLEETIEVIELQGKGTEKTSITNKEIFSSNETEFSKADPKKGFILSYLVNQNGRREKKATLNLRNLSRFNTEIGYRTDLLELIYYPRNLTQTQQQKVQTYLSIKYGISLLGIADYISSEDIKVWDAKENEMYNNRVTGIGQDVAMGLNQKQSGNAQKEGLFIGFGTFEPSNKANTYPLTDQSYLMWGDNNGSIQFLRDKKESGEVKKIQRIWKMQNTQKDLTAAFSTQVMIEKQLFSMEADTLSKAKRADEKEVIWLVIDRAATERFDYHQAEYYISSTNAKNQVVFNDVRWDTDQSGSDTFTFVKAPDFFVDYTITDAACDLEGKGAFDLKIIGGKAPFTVEYASIDTITNTTAQHNLKLAELLSGQYKLSVTDAMQRNQKDTLTVNGLKNVAVFVEDIYTLNENEAITITPKIDNPEKQDLLYSWKHEGNTRSTEGVFTVFEEGDYSLVVSNNLGCQNEMTFRVDNKDSLLVDEWSIFPNPCLVNEVFSIQFNLMSSSEVSVAYYDLSNRLIKSNNIGKMKSGIYTDSLSTTGTFLVVISINGQTSSSKIIIQ